MVVMMMIHPYMHACIHPSINASIHTYIHASIHTYVHTYIHTYIHPFIHTFIHTYIHPFIHTYVHPSINPFIPYIIFLHHRMLLLGVVETMMRWIRRLNSISGVRRGRMPVELRSWMLCRRRNGWEVCTCLLACLDLFDLCIYLFLYLFIHPLLHISIYASIYM
jgi:hypothetical protein